MEAANLDEMAMRDLVMGGGACVVPGGDGASSSSNPLGGLADSLLGGASKTQVRLEGCCASERHDKCWEFCIDGLPCLSVA